MNSAAPRTPGWNSPSTSRCDRPATAPSARRPASAPVTPLPTDPRPVDRSRPRPLLITLVVFGLILAPSATSATPSGLPQLREQLSEAEQDLAAVEAALQRAEAAITDASLRVEQAQRNLEMVERELADAELAREQAARTERAAATAAAEANTVLDAQIGDHLEARGRLETRAIHLYKHGPVLPEAALLRGMTAASDWHEVAVNRETVSRVVDQERRLVVETATLTREIVAGREAMVATRQAAVTAARRTAAEERRVARLVDRQRRALEQLAAEQVARAQVLAELEQDAEVRAALVSRLRSQLASLELSASQVLIPIDLDVDLDGPPPAWAAGLPSGGREWAPLIDAVATRRGIDGRLLAAVVWTESNFRPTVVSHAGAIGLAQLMPGTARGLRVDPWDPVQNLDGGARYLRTQLERFGSLDLALAAYNAGPNRVQRAGPGVPNIVETQLYVVRVIERYQALAAE